MAYYRIMITNVSGTKSETFMDPANIRNNITIEDVETLKANANNLSAAKISFVFSSDYLNEKDAVTGGVQVKGLVFYFDEDKKIAEIETKWKKEKILPLEIAQASINLALGKSHLTALSICKDMELPPLIPMPRIDNLFKEKEAEAKGSMSQKNDKPKDKKK